MDYHARFLVLVDQIERTCPVIHWQIGGVPVWPLARAALYVNITQEKFGEGGAKGYVARQTQGWTARAVQKVSHAATPLINLWQSRRDIPNMIVVPRQANALFLGDNDSLDLSDGAWKDRFCDPLIAHMQQLGRSTLLMQRGDLRRLPWKRPTLAANTVVHWGQLCASAVRLAARQPASLPDYDNVLKRISDDGVPIYGLEAATLRRRAAEITTTAYGFELLLQVVRPKFCFMVGYHWGMGHALTLACRRRGILSVELQRTGLGAQNETYCYARLPENGYSILPAVFWSWTEHDAAAFEPWKEDLHSPWHRGLHGGHPQMLPWFDDDSAESRASDVKIDQLRSRAPADLEILVGLQALPGYDHVWNMLADFIERAPTSWRWWLRVHPRVLPSDPPPGRLLTIRKPNVIIEEAAALPLPALLRKMDLHVSLSSGSAVEASMFGLDCIFLDEYAAEKFPHLIDSRRAEIVTDMSRLHERLSNFTRGRTPRDRQPPLSTVLAALETMADEYARLCRQ